MAASGSCNTADSCRKLLVDTRVKQLEHLQGSNLTILTDCSTVEAALKVLSERRILSAPVVSPDGSPAPSHSTSATEGAGGGPAGTAAAAVVWPASLPNSDIMGFVCVNDILNSFLECYAREYSDPSYLTVLPDNPQPAPPAPPPEPAPAPAGPAAANGAPSPPAPAPAPSDAAAAAGDGGTGAGAATSSKPRPPHVVVGSGPQRPRSLARVSAAGEHGSMLARMRRLEELGGRFAQQQLRDLSCKGCDGDFLHSRHAGEARLLELVMYGFLEPKRRGMHEGEQQAQVVHRVALFDNSGAITSVISQSDIVRFLADNSARLGELAGSTMSELGWDDKRVVSCTPDTPALDAMRLMVCEGVSSLAVVAEPEEQEEGGQEEGAAVAGGRLLGNFSASEMRTMTAEHFGALSLPVGEFLALEHDTEYVAAAAGWAANRERLLEEEGVLGSPAHSFIRDRVRRARPQQQSQQHAGQGQGQGHTAHQPQPQPGSLVGQRLVVARPDTTFGEVLQLLVAHRVHRVYVVNARLQPVGIVTCTDVLRKVVELATAAVPPAAGASPAAVAAAAAAAAAATAEAVSGGHPLHAHHPHPLA
ncbi:hypothetical protein HYH02_006549 [Chlamydomonas schloesseri]|uniref:CBS domain-containing protein n=1 Tax=Chlamydomonas schloesseri TaxID=2026947 RepID=A0A835T7T1_9CHLO|nr:hypothetical protein HYH02_006549 [Chlamydomonas schloesseri]|eukprot:KAG2439021.1 hypothetical protein HYH02_006549 [Chlamydomonas schloesseri]